MRINIPGAARKDAFAVPPERLTIPGLDNDDKTSPYQKRRIQRAGSQSEAFLESLREHGVITAVKVIKRADDLLVVADGIQRVVGARQINRERAKTGEPLLLVETMVPLTKADEDQFHQLMLIGNTHRTSADEDLRARIEQAVYLGETCKWDDKTIAGSMGVTVKTLRAWLATEDAAPAVKKAFLAGEIKATAVTELVRAGGAAAQEKKLAEAKKDGKRVTAKKARETVQERGNPPPSRKVLRTLMSAREAWPYDAAAESGVFSLLAWIVDGGEEPSWVADALCAADDVKEVA